ncbi:Alr1390 protein [Candidatus Moduliflexus flocculans]|uniref:Alr1390 protein n=1 Tax=Candidatus Moduliflexus flocculans TaxID=1499966 RepID=A0A0S6W355_9BACT|nr:Alr1390 protein [Candidatus Moduliflexus flocculans]
MKKLVFLLSHLLFWGWNLLWLVLVYIWILPAIGIDLIAGAFEGVIPINFAVTLLLLFAVPTVCTILGFRKHFRASAYNLISLLYGVEAPLFLLLLLWLFLIRERTLSNSFMLATLLAVIAAFAIELAYGYAQRRKALAVAQLIGHTLMVFVAVYLATLLMFYVAPLAFMLIREFFRFEWLEGLFDFLRHLPEIFPLGLIWLGFFLFSLTLFIGFPAALVSLYSYSGARLWQRFARQFGRIPAIIGAAAVMIAWLFGFAAINQQPQHKAFFLLEQIAQKNSARQALLAESNTIRKGLLNAYLQSYRYLSPKQDATNICEWYKSKDAFHFSVPVAQWFQDAHNLLLSPFLYDGEADDAEKAAKLYAEFFDMPIQRGETAAIKRALSSTYNRDEVKAGLININEEKVWLAQQQITVEPHGDWANVELYEVYENQTPEEQEVFYSFSLPESAVMTGLWLGDSANRDTRFAFQISPRGAAQQVYNEQVRVRRDPALLEQVGPRHYRLRAFPVPAKQSAMWQNRGRQRETSNAAATPPKTLHLWLTYKVMRRDDQWPLPDLGEKRNIYWTKKTTCNYNGYETKHSGDDWLPPFLKANQPGEPALHELVAPGGYRVTITPLTPADYAMPQGKRFALLIDTSYSMNTQAETLKQTLHWLKSDVLTANAVDLYLIDAQPELSRRVEYLGNAAFDLDELTFYGTVQFQEMISRFMALRGDTAYDAILLMTDEGSYELAQDKTTLPTLPAPLWMVHLGGMPKAYDDATLQAIEVSGGGVASDAREVLQRLATTAKFGVGVNIVDGYKWQVEQTAETVAFAEQPDLQAAFDSLAARQLLRAIGKQLDMSALTSLDLAHGIAKQFQIVSPYSSMIVLVNDEQRKALEEAENKADRFEREVETGHEALQKPFNPLKIPAAGAAGNVPEPGTIGLLGLGLVLLARHVRRKRRAIM